MKFSALRLTVIPVLTIILLLVSACMVEQTRPDDLVKQVTDSGSVHVKKVLSVGSVTGGEKEVMSIWVPRAPKINNDNFRRLLKGSIKRADLFDDVYEKSSGDYVLNAEIIYQDNIPGITSTVMLLVRYELKESKTEELLWEQNIYTQREMNFEEIFVGEQRVVRLFELSLIENIEALISALETRFAFSSAK